MLFNSELFPGHGFKTLVNSRNIPNATHILANQFDLLWYVTILALCYLLIY